MAKSTVVGVGAAVALIVGGAVYTVQSGGVGNELNSAANGEVAIVNPANGNLVYERGNTPGGTPIGFEEDAATTIAQLTEEVERAHARIAELEEERDAESSKTDSAGTFFLGANNSPGSDPNQGLTKSLRLAAKDLVTGGVVMLASAGTRIEATGRERYSGLFALLGLPAEVQSQVRDLLVENLSQLAAAGSTRQDLQSGRLDTGPLEGELAQLLTQEELQLWRDYEENIDYYQTMQQYALDLMENAPGLTNESRDVVASYLAEQRMIMDAAGDSNGRVGNWERDLNVLAVTQELLSGTFEDGEQNAFFEDYVTQQQDIVQERLDFASTGGAVEYAPSPRRSDRH